MILLHLGWRSQSNSFFLRRGEEECLYILSLVKWNPNEKLKRYLKKLDEYQKSARCGEKKITHLTTYLDNWDVIKESDRKVSNVEY